METLIRTLNLDGADVKTSEVPGSKETGNEPDADEPVEDRALLRSAAGLAQCIAADRYDVKFATKEVSMGVQRTNDACMAKVEEVDKVFC